MAQPTPEILLTTSLTDSAATNSAPVASECSRIPHTRDIHTNSAQAAGVPATTVGGVSAITVDKVQQVSSTNAVTEPAPVNRKY